MGLVERVQSAWNAFKADERSPIIQVVPGQYTFNGMQRPDRFRFRPTYDRSMVTAVYNRIAIDCAAVAIHHVRLDDEGNFFDVMDSTLEKCLAISANIDQTGRALIQDTVMSLCDEGCVAVVPVDTDINPETGAFRIYSLRVGKVLEWYPNQVRVQLFNEQRGIKQEIVCDKRSTAIIENPLYSVMNEPNSTARRLMRKLQLLDKMDDRNGSDKLDLIIQLPYVIKSPQKREQAELRRKDIEMQLTSSKYGIAYTDGTEQITQLNRPIENTLPQQIETLRNNLFNEIGMTTEVFQGTADEATMLNYYNRTIEPILSAIVDEFKRKFLSKTAYAQGQSIVFIRNPFRLVPVNQLAEIADKFTRNEILSPNEVRAIIGYQPSGDPQSDELRNRNINQKDQGQDKQGVTPGEEATNQMLETEGQEEGSK